MTTMNRRAFLGAAGLGGAGVAIGPFRGTKRQEEEYRVRPNLAFGVGRGEAAILSVLWLPAAGREQLPPIKARMVIFDMGGKTLAEKEVAIAPYGGATLEYALPGNTKRQQAFSYTFVEGFNDQLGEELFGGVDVYDVASGKTNAAGAVAGLG